MQADLAREAQVSLSTVRDFEKGRRTPYPNNARALAAAIERAGIRLTFTPAGAARGIEKMDS